MFENIQSTYNTYFTGAERPPVPDYMPCTTSFKLLAEVPIQCKTHRPLRQTGCTFETHMMCHLWDILIPSSLQHIVCRMLEDCCTSAI